jgi:hypothetical protein
MPYLERARYLAFANRNFTGSSGFAFQIIVLVLRANDSSGGRVTAGLRGLFPLLHRRSRFSC